MSDAAAADTAALDKALANLLGLVDGPSEWRKEYQADFRVVLAKVEALRETVTEEVRRRDEWKADFERWWKRAEAAEAARDAAVQRVALLEALDELSDKPLETALEQAQAALWFYADENNWTQPTSWGGRIHDDESAAIEDGGSRARAALAGGGQ